MTDYKLTLLRMDGTKYIDPNFQKHRTEEELILFFRANLEQTEYMVDDFFDKLYDKETMKLKIRLPNDEEGSIKIEILGENK